jgi:hypothetical protein
MNNRYRLPEFTAENSLYLSGNSRFAADSALPGAGMNAVVPQAWCEGPPRLGQRCCEQWGGELVCWTIGPHTEM